jgi:AcrR family transcriptional regulator
MPRPTSISTSDAPGRASLTERRQARRDQLLDAAIDVIRREGAEVTMEEMASAGGISKPILYRHFTDRDGLVAAITEQALAELGAALDKKLQQAGDAAPQEAIRTTIDVFFDYVEREPELYRFIVDNDARHGNRTTHAFAEHIAAHVAREIASGLGRFGRQPGPAEIWGRAIVGMCQNTAEWWNSGAPIDRHQLVDELTDFVWGGMMGVREPA